MVDSRISMCGISGLRIIRASFYVVLLPGNITNSSLLCTSQLFLSDMECLSDVPILFYNLPDIIIIYR